MSDLTPHDPGLSEPLEGALEASTAEGETGPAVGRDEWVARHGENRGERTGVLGDARAPAASRCRGGRGSRCSSGIACLLPLGFESGYVRRVAFDTVIYVLLALGLNVVVGWGGLLDLGYVAFFGVGAYSYAILASDKFDYHVPTAAR